MVLLLLLTSPPAHSKCHRGQKRGRSIPFASLTDVRQFGRFWGASRHWTEFYDEYTAETGSRQSTRSARALTSAELIAAASARPIKLNVGTALPGTPPQIFAHVLAHIAGIEVSYVAYRSGLDAMAALLRGEIQVLVDAPVIMLPEVQAGTIKILVVSSREREHELPAVPTLAEAGYPAAESEPWVGLVASSRSPAEVVARLNRAALSALASPNVRQRFEALGVTPRGNTSEEFRALIAREHAHWSAMIYDADIHMN